jgi:hypothetical protein
MRGAMPDSELLALWETGSSRHPLDRTLLLAAWALADAAPSELEDMPLGAVNETLVRLRATGFGSRIHAWIDCARCGERLELDLDTRTLLAAATRPDARAEVDLAGLRFRRPTTRDLAAIASELDTEVAARKLMLRCCTAGKPDDTSALADLLSAVEQGLEEIDPMADIRLSLSCAACGHDWIQPFDIGALLWDEVAQRARTVLSEVDALARAYGWSEAQILALSQQRRAAYLAMVAP